MVADYHIEAAKNLMKKFYIQLKREDLAFLPEGTKEFDNYWEDLEWCQKYALINHHEIKLRLISILSAYMRRLTGNMILEEIVCSHNYARRENHFGQNVFITRKGAISARDGELGIIPGSMGTKSYIVRGKGNPDSFCSASHGAGRKMSRKEAKKQFKLADIIEQTNGVCCKKDESILDELPNAYKNLDIVMENQKDLVEPIYELKQILCIKG